MQISTMKFIGIFLGIMSCGHQMAGAQDLPISPIPGAGKVAALAVPVASTSNPQASALPIQQLWTLQAGETIGHSLRVWAEKAQWSVVWSLPRDWVVPSTASFTGSFPDAAEKVIKTLSANGALVRAQIYEGNRTIVVTGPGTTQQ
ncbi:toxin co-regulated pilus biosynthesis Q family protein [Acidovorax carolinensis]|nr:toxin co-regulated pilus biosynthesis Q family protein [Acidovorax carolinensis]